MKFPTQWTYSDANGSPTCAFVVALLIVIIVFSMLSAVFSGVAMKAGFEGLDTMANRYIAASGRTDTGAGAFFGAAEPPVFYDIGDIDATRGLRNDGQTVVEPLSAEDYARKGFEGLDDIMLQKAMNGHM